MGIVHFSLKSLKHIIPPMHERSMKIQRIVLSRAYTVERDSNNLKKSKLGIEDAGQAVVEQDHQQPYPRPHMSTFHGKKSRFEYVCSFH